MYFCIINSLTSISLGVYFKYSKNFPICSSESRSAYYFTSNNTKGNANRENATAGGKGTENKWGGLNFRCSICRPRRMLYAHPARAQFCRCSTIFARKHVYVHVRTTPFARLTLALLFLLIDPSCLVFTGARHLPTDQQFVDVHSAIVLEYRVGQFNNHCN